MLTATRGMLLTVSSHRYKQISGLGNEYPRLHSVKNSTEDSLKLLKHGIYTCLYFYHSDIRSEYVFYLKYS